MKQEPVLSIKQSDPLRATAPVSAPTSATTPIPAAAPAPVSAIKKGFLTSAKSSIYPESISAKIKPQTNGLKAPPIILPDMSLKNKNENKNERGDIRDVFNLKKPSGMEGTGSLVEELTDAEIRQLTKTGNITKTKHGPVPVPAPSQSTPSLPSDSSTNSNSSSDGDKKLSLLPSSPFPSSSPSPSSSFSPSSSDSLASNSSASSSSSLGHHSTEGHASSPSSSNAGHPSKAPTYTLLERGIVSMGDFETLKSRNTSIRPSELVCRISVPLVTKASIMVLDVAER